MERALHRNAPCILIQGLGGVGKTTLARGFLRWLDETDGLEAALWFDFRDIRSAEYVVNRTGELFYGENFGAAANKLDLLAQAFREHRVVVVWDNFESAAQNLSTADRSELDRFLGAIHGTLGKVIITSRSPEAWLAPSRRFPLPLRGLDGEERWEYCETIVGELGLRSKVNRNDPELKNLMDQLAGHPLAMRVVLPKLERMPAAEVLRALKENGDYLETMAKAVDSSWTRSKIDQLLSTLVSAGLMKELGSAIYEMHPLLTSYLRSRRAVLSEPMERAFVDVMGRVAESLAPRELHEQEIPFTLHGANFRTAMALAAKLSLEIPLAELLQSLAAYAQNSRDFVEAKRLSEELAQHARARADLTFEASASHQLGRIAQEQRDFARARECYLKSLAIREKQGNLRGAASTYHQLGRIAEEQREFAKARECYLKSLAISEKQGNLHYAAGSYHQLGMIAEEQRDFAAARDWYLKSLTIDEKQGNLHGAALSYGQLGILAQKQDDFATARDWYLKSLAISEKQGNLRVAATTYHQLGMIAEQQRDFATARNWYLKALAISEKQGNLHGAALSYHQLGVIAEQQRDFATARDWYLKSLAISEKQGDLHAAALTYHQLGRLAGLEENMKSCAEFLVRAIRMFLQAADEYWVEGGIWNFVSFYRQSSEGEKAVMKGVWEEGGLGPFPTETTE
jgi:tetratricopeptide (TPR) repeat protein